jgi:hypothetical protein
MKALRTISDQYQIEIRKALDFIEDGEEIRNKASTT